MKKKTFWSQGENVSLDIDTGSYNPKEGPKSPSSFSNFMNNWLTKNDINLKISANRIAM